MKIIKNNLNLINLINYKSYFFFKIGIILLPSAFPLGGLFLLIAISVSAFKRRSNFLKDKLNYPIILSTILLIIISIYHSINMFRGNYYINQTPFISEINKYTLNILLDIFNWIPLFLVYWGSQEFLNTPEKRQIFAKYLIIGTIPVIFSCIAQYWFYWQDTLYGLNGLIIWFQKPNDRIFMSGLFSNPNYTGFWMSVAWPFSYVLFLENNVLNFKKITAFLIFILIFYITLMTNSRNALLGIIISSFFIFRNKLKYKIIFPITFLFIIVLISNSYLPFQNINNFVENASKSSLLLYKLSNLDFANIINNPRIELWTIAIVTISQRILTGWGAGTFSTIYSLEGGINDLHHTHNIFLEISFNYGVPLALVLTTFIIYLFVRLLRINFNFKSTRTINKAWITGSLISILFHVTDMPYYEGKISIIFWILLAGLKCIGDENYLYKSTQN